MRGTWKLQSASIVPAECAPIGAVRAMRAEVCLRTRETPVRLDCSGGVRGYRGGQIDASRSLFENSRKRRRAARRARNWIPDGVCHRQRLPVDDEPRDPHPVGERIHRTDVRRFGSENILIESQHHGSHRRIAVVAERDGLAAGDDRCRSVEACFDLVVGPELPVIATRTTGRISRPRSERAPDRARHRNVSAHCALRQSRGLRSRRTGGRRSHGSGLSRRR